MKSIVLYATKTGNTEKAAKAVSNALKIDCLNIANTTDLSELDINAYDLIFIGSGVYGGRPHKKLRQFLQQLEFSSQKTIAVFLTWLGRGNSDNAALKVIKNILNSKDQNVDENYFKCYGKAFCFIRKNHPERKDLEDAVQWANSVLQK